jgi:hypothetical protein
MDAQQELYTKLLLELKAYFEKQGYEVYDGVLPPEGAAYPFVYLGDFRQTDTPTKAGGVGTVYPLIHVWHNDPRRRGTVSGMLKDVKKICNGIEHTDSFSWLLQEVTQRILSDNTTKTPLLHGVVEITFRFS